MCVGFDVVTGAGTGNRDEARGFINQLMQIPKAGRNSDETKGFVNTCTPPAEEEPRRARSQGKGAIQRQ